MKNQEHIDRIVNKILKSRKMDPDTITALGNVIMSLSNVKERVESENTMTQEDTETPEALFGNTFGLKDIENIEIDGQTHPLKIVPSTN